MKTGKIIVSKHLSERLKDVMDRTSENVISDVSEKQSQPVNKKEDFSELNKLNFPGIFSKYKFCIRSYNLNLTYYNSKAFLQEVFPFFFRQECLDCLKQPY